MCIVIKHNGDYITVSACGKWPNKAVASVNHCPEAYDPDGNSVMTNKSILDGVPVVENDVSNPMRQNSPPLTVVGKCTSCGAPIYGRNYVLPQDDIQVKFSCECKKRIDEYRDARRRSLDDVKQTK